MWTQLTTVFISALVNILFIFLYSAYSKALKTLDFRLLSEIFLGEKGVDFTLVQLNKVVALTAVTLVSMAFLPRLSDELRFDLLVSALVHITIHTVYSAWRYYGTPNIDFISKFPKILTQLRESDPKKRGKGIKKMSIVYGILANLAVIASLMGWISSFKAANLLCVGLGMAHFYFMEIDNKFVLQVRPFALLTFPLAFVALGNGLIFN